MKIGDKVITDWALFYEDWEEWVIHKLETDWRFWVIFNKPTSDYPEVGWFESIELKLINNLDFRFIS